VIAASGNDGMCDSMSRPACFSDVVSVGAVYDNAMGVYGWCVNSNSCANTERNFGCSTRTAVFEDTQADNVIAYSNSASFLDVVAPATCATSAAPNNATTNCFGGTSSATPFTSGVAALAVQAAGKGVLSPADMLTVLATSGEPVTDPKNLRVSPRVNGLEATLLAETYGGGPVNNAPVASFTFSCTELACTFDGSGSTDDGSIDDYAWAFGDDGTGSGVTTGHTYSADGSYTVTLTVTDDGGKTSSTSQTVSVSGPVVNQPPVAAFDYSCSGLSCDFTDQSSDDNGVTSWNWTFGTDGSSNAQNPTHTFSAEGTYNVTLVVSDGDLSDSTSQSVTVTEPGVIEVNLVGSASASRNKWTATVTDLNGNDLAGTWSADGTASCSGNVCTLSGLHTRKVLSVTFTESITGNGESIVINQP
jgi:PKD repeat protein